MPTPETSSSPSAENRRLDEAAGGYLAEAGQADVDFVSHYTRKLQEPWSRGASALQLGLGNGALARELASGFGEFTVVEGSAALVRAFADAPANCRLAVALFEEFSPSRRFDRIFGNHVLEHVLDPVDLLRRTRDWLQPDGRALFTVPNAGSLHRRIGVEMGLLERPDALNAQDQRLGHRRVYSARGFQADLEQAGYVVEAFHGYMLKVVSNAQMKGWSREFLDASYRVSLTLPPEFGANLFAVCRGR